MQGDGIHFRSLTDGAGRFVSWWRDELWNLMPEPVRRVISRAGANVVLAEVEGGFQVLAPDISPAKNGSSSETVPRGQALLLLTEMAANGVSNVARIRIPVSRCYSRRMELPRAARGDAPRILSLDLERVTPFKLKDVYTAHLQEGDGSKGKVWVRQLVAKREAVDSLIADVRSSGFEVEAVDCWETEPSAGIPLNFLERDLSRESGVANNLISLPRALVAAILISMLAFVVLTISRHEAALADLRVETSKMRERAISVRKTLDRADTAVGNLARLQELKLARVSTLEIIEELSRVLPDPAWLSEFRLEGDALDVSGLAKSGAALPSLFAQSRIFSEAALTAPLTLDPREDKERFSLRLRIKQPVSGEIDDKARKR